MWCKISLGIRVAVGLELFLGNTLVELKDLLKKGLGHRDQHLDAVRAFNDLRQGELTLRELARKVKWLP